MIQNTVLHAARLKLFLSSLKEMATLAPLTPLDLGAQPAAGRQDDVLGEGDVQAAVALDAHGPREICEADVHAVVAQVVAVAVRDQPAFVHAAHVSIVSAHGKATL